MPLAQLVSAIALSTVIAIALAQGQDGSGPGITVGGFVAFIGAMLMLVAPTRRLADIINPITRGLAALERGLDWVRRLEKVSRPHRMPGLAQGGVVGLVNNLAFILGAVLLMAPFGFVPFSNTLPAVALLLFAIGFLQRDGGAVLLGHLANVATIIYFSVLIGGGGLVVKELFNRVGIG